MKPTRGTLGRQQWQQGKKEVINKNQTESKTHSEELKTQTTTSRQANEHYIRVESAENQRHDGHYTDMQQHHHHHEQQQQQQYDDDQRYHQYQNAHEDLAENRQSVNNLNIDSYQQQQQEQQYYNRSEPNQRFVNERDYNQTKQHASDAGQLHGYTTETEVLPARWDGKYPEGYRNYRPKPDQNRSSVNNMYGFCTEPTILPVQWDGKFAKSGETYTVPDRNTSKTNDYYGYDSSPTVLPTVWNGKFQLDPNDVRIKPERNASDVRDYADHRRFVTRE